MIYKKIRQKNILTASFILLFGLLSLYNIKLSFIAVLGMLAMMTFVKMPYLGLAAIVGMLPFSNFSIWNQQLAGIPGMKVANILPLAVLFIYIFVNMRIGIRRRDLIFVTGIIFLLTIGVMKSLPHLNEINYSLDPKLGPSKYVLTYFVKPIIFLTPLVIISSYIKKNRDLDLINKIIIFSIAFFSAYLIYFYIMKVPNRLSMLSVTNSISFEFNMHRNDIVNFYIISYPVILANLLIKKNMFNISNFAMCLICVGLLYSRTGYVLIVFSTLLLLSLTKNKKWLPILVLSGVLAFSLFPIKVVNRSMTGLDTHDFNTITAGRTQGIWMPLIEEFSDNPADLIFGKGTNAIKFSKSYQRGYILKVGHAHNMYLETALEVGIIGLAFFVFFIVYYLTLFFNNLKKLDPKNNLLMNGIIVSIISFLISGLSGRQFFPNIGNSYLWIIFGFGIAIVEINKRISEHSVFGNTEGLTNDIHTTT